MSDPATDPESAEILARRGHLAFCWDDLDAIELAYENDYNWLDKDGSVLHRLPDHDAYQATLFRYSELICRARNRLAVIRDIQDS